MNGEEKELHYQRIRDPLNEKKRMTKKKYKKVSRYLCKISKKRFLK